MLLHVLDDGHSIRCRRQAFTLLQRKPDTECRAMIQFAFYLDAPTVFDDDSIRKRQAQSASLTNRLGRKAWIENTRHIVWRNAFSTVGYFDPDFVMVMIVNISSMYSARLARLAET